ncbi:hypothetical protein M8818_000094 [Zalaria obscura]|uniref:Uncharacterized protein n=1 Tax=Zalaria obscura TaxID=2024903 RepID=A0ACC3SP57_9PEZI
MSSSLDATHRHESVELTGVDSRQYADDDAQIVSSLPPVDGGWQAWSFLAACFVLEATVWGMSFTLLYSIQKLYGSP